MRKFTRRVTLSLLGAGLLAGSASSAQAAAPSANTLPAQYVTATTALLRGTVTTGNQRTLWQFQYGRTTSYGNMTKVQVIPSGQGTVSVSARIGGLRRGTRYHFRLLAEHGTGTVIYPLIVNFGRDRSFLTRAHGNILGTIVAKMDWAFRYAPTYTQIISLLVNKPAVGTAILLQCHGVGCPFAHRSIRVVKVMACKNAGKHCVMTRPTKLQLASRFAGHRLHVGTVVTIELARRNWIGKAYVFKIRAGRGPHYHIGCVAPGSTKVGVGC